MKQKPNQKTKIRREEKYLSTNIIADIISLLGIIIALRHSEEKPKKKQKTKTSLCFLFFWVGKGRKCRIGLIICTV